MTEGRAHIAAGLAVALLGAIPLLWLATAQSEPTATPPTPAAVTSTTGAEAAPIPLLEGRIEGVPQSVTNVLFAAGYATTSGTGQLPESVTRVLEDHQVTLTVPIQTDQTGGP